MPIIRKFAVSIAVVGFFQQVSAHAQSHPSIDVEHQHFGTLSVRATGKSAPYRSCTVRHDECVGLVRQGDATIVRAKRYWLYVNRKIYKHVGSGSNQTVRFLPVDLQLEKQSDNYSVQMVVYKDLIGYTKRPPVQ